MNLKINTEKLNFIKSLIGVAILVGGGVVIAGNYQWVTNDKFDLAMSSQTKALAFLEIRALRRQISFLQTKVRENEATNSERIILPELERQLEDLEDANDANQ